jgi:hypothetical protein
MNSTFVPLLLELDSTGGSDLRSPKLNKALLLCLSRLDSTIKLEESAFTALVPTQFKPNDFL